MPLQLWNYKEHFKKLPSLKLITLYGKRKWDGGSEYKDPTTSITNEKSVFSMPVFGRHGRWGNIVFQYIFIRILALNNNREIELNRAGEKLNNRMNLYEDMANVSAIHTKPETILLDSYHLFPNPLNNIPPYMWRAMFVTKVRLQKCFILEDADEAINKPLQVSEYKNIEVEGLFMVNPILYKRQHKEYILNKLFQPVPHFLSLIEDCIEQFGKDKTIVGIHIRRGDFVSNPLDQMFQIPISSRYIIDWLTTNISSLKNPVIYVCSDDSGAYKEIEKAGFAVLSAKTLMLEDEEMLNYEQIEWEILRRCNVILTSNSSFSFSAAFLNTQNCQCYQFLIDKKKFVLIDPWEAEPLQFCSFAPNLFSYLSSRFSLVSQMVNKKSASKRLVKDLGDWLFWKKTKLKSLYYIYGFSSKYLFKLMDVRELFKVYNKTADHSEYMQSDKIRI